MNTARTGVVRVGKEPSPIKDLLPVETITK